MKLSHASLMSIALFASLFTCVAGESVSVPETVKKQVENILSRASAYAENHGYEHVFYKAPYAIKLADRNGYQEKAYIFQAKDGYNIEILPDGRLIELFNFYASRHGGNGKFEKQPQPSWSQEKAIQIAKEYVESILGEFPQNLGEPKAKFLNRNRWDKQYYQAGEWDIKWPRSDKSGYKFYSLEGISVYIHESEGPNALFVKMFSHFDGVNFDPVKQEEVMPEATKRAQEITQWEVVRGTFANGKLLPEYATGHMEIVQPNYFGTGTEIPTRPDLNARLAWVIWFPWVADGDKNADPKRPRRGVCVWIDAQNKKWLGGDAFAQ